ncbi:MAG TPA: hypothetical protein VFW30_08130 [Bryocella sp.]|nr:hypothetical protein [Bryocella sp.]
MFVAIFGCNVSIAGAEQLPASLRGTWRITRILPTTNSGCWTRELARSLVGTTLTYSQSSMRWRGGVVPIEDIYTRVVSAEDFSKENAGPAPASFPQLGVRAAELVEVDMQHEDAAVLPASTEIPGDSVLIVAPDRIVVSACGVFYEATHEGSRSKTRVRDVSSRRARSDSARATGR